MTDITERLHTIRAHLQTGAVGQREVWEEWLDEAAAEIERMRAAAEPFARNVNATSLFDTLAHISREDLLRLRRALEPKP